ncbi:MAG: hypothetical protein AWU59_2364 [Methanolobus sp. T82-4]|jgi:hypothetical protein|nr:MAG: hypothetical protein AWU59_2364 [Methanolobus sp. T82-4]
MIQKRKLLFFAFIIFLLSVSLFIHALNENAKLWREDGQRDHFIYSVHIEGLSGKKVNGTATILVPLPATINGELPETQTQKKPSLEQHILDKYILHTPEVYSKGPYFSSLTEQLDNKSFSSGWSTFIVKIEDGYMLKLESNASTLNDFDIIEEVVMEDIDIFDPINKGGPILYPAFNISEISSVTYGEQSKYSSSINYETYVYFSDNIKDGIKSVQVSIDAINDPTEWDKEYRGRYMVTVVDDIEGAGKIKVDASLTQEFWFTSG